MLHLMWIRGLEGGPKSREVYFTTCEILMISYNPDLIEYGSCHVNACDWLSVTWELSEVPVTAVTGKEVNCV